MIAAWTMTSRPAPDLRAQPEAIRAIMAEDTIIRLDE